MCPRVGARHIGRGRDRDVTPVGEPTSDHGDGGIPLLLAGNEAGLVQLVVGIVTVLSRGEAVGEPDRDVAARHPGTIEDVALLHGIVVRRCAPNLDGRPGRSALVGGPRAAAHSERCRQGDDECARQRPFPHARQYEPIPGPPSISGLISCGLPYGPVRSRQRYPQAMIGRHAMADAFCKFWRSGCNTN